MSSRLQVIVPDGLGRTIQRAAQRRRLSTSAWVRQAIERQLAAEQPDVDALDRLAGLGAPTGDIDQMLAEIEDRSSRMIFVDSNVPMYVAGADHPNRDVALRFLARARSGEVQLCTSTEVLQEIVHRYAGLGRLDLADEVYELFVQLCEVIFAVTIADTDRARSILRTNPGLSVRDAVHAAVMIENGVTDIATFDRGFDRIREIVRIDLG